MSNEASPRDFPPTEPESLSQLRGDCARMAPRWPALRHDTGAPGRPPAPWHSPAGIHVPARSADLLEGMSEYGD